MGRTRRKGAQTAGAARIVAVGLGPGRWDDLTVEAHATLMAAERIICRTLRH
ncbi:MAG: SAM-dependent methyltransferase, partial [Ktedonobacterales bacterium]